MDSVELIKYLRNLGIDVNTKTKARGHQGFFLKNRIDISKNIPQHRVIPTLLHEFAHYIHYNIEPDMPRNGGSFEKLFKENKPYFETELLKVTNFVDENSLCVKLYENKDKVRNQIKKQKKIIKNFYPKFQRSKNFKEFDKYIKKSKARYLLKYDRVKLIERKFFKKSVEILSISDIEHDFPEMPEAFSAYIRLRSLQRKQKRISARINKLKKYYTKPAELFARFVEGIYLDKEWTYALAPNVSKEFQILLDSGYYGKLKELIERFN